MTSWTGSCWKRTGDIIPASSNFSFSSKINKLDRTITKNDENEILEARNAYNALADDTLKGKVSNLAKLQEAETRLAELKLEKAKEDAKLALDTYKDEDNYHTDLITKLYPNSNIHFAYNNGRLELRINPHLAEAICNDKFYKAPFEEDDPEGEEGAKRMNNGFRKMRIFISDNLFRYLKYLHFEGSWDYENYFVLSLSTTDYNNALTKEINGREYKVYEGDEVNIMEWCDYIGIAVTSPDFPIKQQIYPHFMYDFDNPTAQNRRRYVNVSEYNIEGFKNVFANESSITKDMFGGERVNEQIKTSIHESILFIKYFGKGDDINNINYENSDSNTSLKMDIENMTPLQKFTLRLYWIDRYNNFIPLVPLIEEYDDIIKMQLHFQCIKGSEKENYYIIEPVSQEPTTITGVYDKSEKERVVIQTDPETGQEMVEVYEIPPNNKRNKVIEEEMEFNPINELY